MYVFAVKLYGNDFYEKKIIRRVHFSTLSLYDDQPVGWGKNVTFNLLF